MKQQDDDLARLRAWLVEDTGSEDDADRLLPVVERLRRLRRPDITPAKTADLSRRLIEEQNAQQAERRRQRTVVCIEDDAAALDLVTLILQTRGFEVLGAIGGQEGLDLVSKSRPDLVLLDLLMPGMDGWEVYQRMKADDYMRTVPVIVVTAKAQPIDQVLGRSIAKVEDYITKPFSAGDLVKSVRKVLGDLEAA